MAGIGSGGEVSVHRIPFRGISLIGICNVLHAVRGRLDDHHYAFVVLATLSLRAEAALVAAAIGAVTLLGTLWLAALL